MSVCVHVSVCVSVERVRQVLPLMVEGKSGVVNAGELTVVLDGLSVDQQTLHNSSTNTTSGSH